ncbi:hypothetical protein [uncultured Parvibaculum sp.]|uniref:hypothetical protein n=1 Tax=uncultured Parvibaculum sp. TaxID=291828 RepID=UPI0030DCCD5B
MARIVRNADMRSRRRHGSFAPPSALQQEAKLAKGQKKSNREAKKPKADKNKKKAPAAAASPFAAPTKTPPGKGGKK